MEWDRMNVKVNMFGVINSNRRAQISLDCIFYVDRRWK